jgi:hypothetical protein
MPMKLINEIWSLAILAALFTGIMLFLPTFAEADFWGKFLNNFLYLVAFYMAARLAVNFQWRKRK